ncbi:uncharacterized protein LOC142181784 [Nicotiana tabacum]|uniref:Uncharacterized protein LOC142181784 n=1 Tax=Nicotiana tabacum TaxID=4097 RepID=A0AC58UPJ6_TOBAC
MEQRQFEEEEDIESTAGNFHQVAKEAGLSPKSRLRKESKTYSTGYKGSPFTWWNGRPNAACVFKRLDRILVNTKQDTFMDVVKYKWNADFIRDPFLMFKHKLKRVKTALSKWSREIFGDILKKFAIPEDIVKVKEMLFEEEPTIENRIILQRAQTELKKYLSLEEQYWKQKTGMTWFAEGDRDTIFFHNHVNGKRKKLQLRRIHNEVGIWLEDQQQMANSAAQYYLNQFTNQGDPTDFSMLDKVPPLVSTEQNMELCRYPTLEEGKAAVFELSADSSSGPDGFTGMFYQKCWELICYDTHNMVLQFYGGSLLPKFITHTNLVLLPKMSNPESFTDLRPISLSNYINKILSRGVKQGDPLSPALFILSAEVLSRLLNKLFDDKSFIGFGMPKWIDPVNHLEYADNTIIFASAHQPSLNKIMTMLKCYEQISGQQNNAANRSYYLHANTSNLLIQSVGGTTGFTITGTTKF